MGRDKKTADMNLVMALMGYFDTADTVIPIHDIALFFGKSDKETEAILASAFELIGSSYSRMIVDGFVINSFDDTSTPFTRPLLFTHEETAALSLVLSYTNFPKDSALVKKLDAAGAEPLDACGRELLQHDSGTTEGELLASLNRWIATRHCVSFRYRKENEREFGEPRTVEPFELYHEGAFWYLDAWCRNAQDWRTFRLDRMKEPEMQAAHVSAAHEEEYEARRGESGATPDFRGSERVQLSFSAEYPFAAVEWPGYRTMRNLSCDEHPVYSIPYLQADWIARRILAAAGGITVPEGHAVQERIASIARETLAEYEAL